MFPSPDSFEITPPELQALLADNSAPPFHLIDCREEDEFAICKIEGASLVPLSRFAEAGPAYLGDGEQPAIVYCHHGMRSMNATMFLRDKGFAEVWSLAGGIDLWSTQIDDGVPRY
ncbi:MAG: rhodanese-like domain-containing protein [Verrucomicrobiales bacterium]|nr:rhodanese-like domain-containing protein [Verrucomicrobiales bacterium]